MQVFCPTAGQPINTAGLGAAWHPAFPSGTELLLLLLVPEPTWHSKAPETELSAQDKMIFHTSNYIRSVTSPEEKPEGIKPDPNEGIKPDPNSFLLKELFCISLPPSDDSHTEHPLMGMKGSTRGYISLPDGPRNESQQSTLTQSCWEDCQAPSESIKTRCDVAQQEQQERERSTRPGRAPRVIPGSRQMEPLGAAALNLEHPLKTGNPQIPGAVPHPGRTALNWPEVLRLPRDICDICSPGVRIRTLSLWGSAHTAVSRAPQL